MTIKKRLFWSNILMIFVPVGATALVGMLCVGIVWLSLMNGAGLGLKDQEDFDHARMALTEMIESRLSRDADLSALELLLDNNGMSVAVWQDGQNFYRYGASKSDDDILMEAAEILGRDAAGGIFSKRACDFHVAGAGRAVRRPRSDCAYCYKYNRKQPEI